ncbi:MAG: ECF transporter S component [Clostridiales bacterium]|nr:ECF transporter S component [Clostridiales bacterium]
MENTSTSTSTKPYSGSITLRITTTAVFMALTIAMASFGIPVPGGHLYLCDVIICLAAILLGPLDAFVVGGLGSFFGDMIFYPLPMFVSLVTHGLQAIVISLIAHHTFKNHPKVAAGIGVSVGAVIMVVGYTLGKIFVYSTFEYAMIKLPYEIAQGALGAVLGMILCYRFGIGKLYNHLANKKSHKKVKEQETA